MQFFQCCYFHVREAVSGQVEVSSRGLVYLVISDITMVLGEPLRQGFTRLPHILVGTPVARDIVNRIAGLAVN